MARVCGICGKGKQIGYTISHAHNKTKKEWLPNLQTVKIMVGKSVKRVRVCTKCIKKGNLKKVA
jgi:large subunit ribosomal protein L28